jgi:YD repeat-containing protein
MPNIRSIDMPLADYLNVANTIDLSSGSYTIEGYVNVSTISSGHFFNLFATNNNSYPGRWMFDFGTTSGTTAKLRFATESNAVLFYSNDVSYTLGTWAHFAFVNDSQGNIFRMFFNGSLVGSRAAVPLTSYSALQIGKNGSSWSASPYYLDDLRITKGIAVYTAAFTPPAAPLTNVAALSGSTLTPASKGHMVGDLQTITEPGGFVTTFNLYEPNGKVVQMTDPKGVVTDITYTLRGFVKTLTTTAPGLAARTTTYNYDNVGQVTGVIQPDGSTINYTYDAAHRLTGVTDAKGNSITYTLDNMGNRTTDQLKDPQGILQRQVQRTFDALNRVQQVTGAPR